MPPDLRKKCDEVHAFMIMLGFEGDVTFSMQAWSTTDEIHQQVEVYTMRKHPNGIGSYYRSYCKVPEIMADPLGVARSMMGLDK
jgi:hypothetical protein